MIWREDCRQLQLLGKDYGQGKLIQGNLLIDYDQLSLVGFDEDGNMRAFKFDPSTKTRDGHQLVVTSEEHLGCRVSATARVTCHSLADNTMYNQSFYKRTAIVFAGVDGSVHVLMPIQVGKEERESLFCFNVCAKF